MPFVRDPHNMVPIMTSNTTPSGIASANSVYSSSFEAWNVFSGSASTQYDAWVTAVGELSGVVAYSFPVPTIINKYTIAPRPEGYTAYAPFDWTLEGLTGEKWVTLHQVKNFNKWVSDSKCIFKIPNKHRFITYRLNVKRTVSLAAEYLAVGKFELCYKPTPVPGFPSRSLLTLPSVSRL